MISLLLSARFGACTAGVRPFPLAMQHIYSFVSHVASFLLSAMQHVYSFVSHVTSLLLSPTLRACTVAFSAGHAAFLFICLPGDLFTSPNGLLLGVLNAF